MKTETKATVFACILIAIFMILVVATIHPVHAHMFPDAEESFVKNVFQYAASGILSFLTWVVVAGMTVVFTNITLAFAKVLRKSFIIYFKLRAEGASFFDSLSDALDPLR